MDAISQMLEGMGATPDAIAATVRRERVLGARDSSSFMNLIVRYLNRNLDLDGKLEVGAGGTTLCMQLEGKVREVPLPLPVQGFLDCFHRGLNPDLVRKE